MYPSFKRLGRGLMTALLGALLLLGTPGCDSDEDPALLRVVHATPGAAALDFFIDFELFTRGLTFRSASPYQRWDPGLRLLEATSSGGSGAPASLETILDAGTAYTILITGGAQAEALLVLEDNRRQPPEGQARLKMVHAAPGLDALEVVVQEDGDPASFNVTLDGPNDVGSIISVDSGDYTVTARPLGGGSALPTLAQRLEAGVRYLVVVTNTAVFLIADG